MGTSVPVYFYTPSFHMKNRSGVEVETTILFVAHMYTRPVRDEGVRMPVCACVCARRKHWSTLLFTIYPNPKATQSIFLFFSLTHLLSLYLSQEENENCLLYQFQRK